MQILAIYNQRILYHPFFLSCSFIVIYREKKNARKTRIDPLISVFRARAITICRFPCKLPCQMRRKRSYTK